MRCPDCESEYTWDWCQDCYKDPTETFVGWVLHAEQDQVTVHAMYCLTCGLKLALSSEDSAGQSIFELVTDENPDHL